jgi:hypothetical protein
MLDSPRLLVFLRYLTAHFLGRPKMVIKIVVCHIFGFNINVLAIVPLLLTLAKFLVGISHPALSKSQE